MQEFDFYIDKNGYLVIPKSDVRFLIDFSISNIPSMPEATETTVRIPGKNGDMVLSTIYEPISFEIVCYTEQNLTPEEKTIEENKITNFINNMKDTFKRFAIEKNNKFYNVKYNGALTVTNFPTFLRFSIPFKSSLSYAMDINKKKIIGNNSLISDTIAPVGPIITIKNAAQSPIIALNDYQIKYSQSIFDGQKLVIDCNKSTITLIDANGTKTNAMRYYNHQFPKIQKGINVLKVQSGINDETQISVEWYDYKF